jgi:hypothetical protein
MLKKSVFLTICLTLLLSLSSTVYATVYYLDSVGGNDNNSGTSPTEAWASFTPVNSTTLGPGDQVLLKAGTSYTGELKPIGGGADGNPVIIDMYGTGDRPRLDGQGLVEAPLFLYNFEYIEVSNLELTNDAATRSTDRWGVHMFAKSYGTVHHVHLKNLYVHDVYGDLTKGDDEESAGIFYECNGPTKSHFDDLLVENCYLLRTDRNGITGWSPHGPEDYSTNVVFRANTVEDCGGDCLKVWGTEGALMEYNYVNGGHMRATDLAAGIWPFASNNCVIQFNEVTNMKGTGDSQAFDSDYNSAYTTIQYNYSHHNEGGFLLVCGPGGGKTPSCLGTVVRYNVSEYDGTNGYRIIQLGGGGVQDTYIYNNAVYVGSQQDLTMIQLNSWRGDPDNSHFYNNIFYVESGGQVDYVYGGSTNNVFENNVYYGTHTNLPSDPCALYSDPMLTNPGGGENGYHLNTGSPAINSGVNIADCGGRDYYGNTAPIGVTDRGVHETTEGGSYCGDETCDPGEDQCNCPEDCGTPPSTETSCTDGIDNDCDTYTDCDDSDCDGDPACAEPYCGDGTCDPDEDQCNCPDDCGTPPSTETSCTDGIDNDCDTYTDCDDSDCDGDPACPECLPKGAACTEDSECCSGNCLPAGKCK